MLEQRPLGGGLRWGAGTGASWRARPAAVGPWATGSSRDRRWRRHGRWQRLIATCQKAGNRFSRYLAL